LNDDVSVPAANACPLCEQAKNRKFESYALNSIVAGLDAINRPLVYASPTGSGIFESVSVMESRKAYENYIKEVQWAEVKSAAGSHEAVFENFGRFADVKTQSGKN